MVNLDKFHFALLKSANVEKLIIDRLVEKVVLGMSKVDF